MSPQEIRRAYAENLRTQGGGNDVEVPAIRSLSPAGAGFKALLVSPGVLKGSSESYLI
jgi:hypothetical protein